MFELPENQSEELDEASKLNWVRLNLIHGLGPRLLQALMERFGSCDSILSASADDLMTVSGVGKNLASSIVNSSNRMRAAGEIQSCQQHGFSMLTPFEPGYPSTLGRIPDPPGLLFVNGDLLAADQLAIGIVGTRHASRYGLAQARSLATGLARAGYTIVSGLARGIDTEAHLAALEAGGRTIAVLGSGLCEIYPPENRELASRISSSGAVISEYLLNHKPKASSFPQRNRIISGLSLGVVVVEAAPQSGALISARHALEQDREVFAVPGRVDSRNSLGCHHLIRDGAKLVENVDHIVEELGPLAEKTTDRTGRTVCHPLELQLNDQERKILEVLDTETMSIDEVIERTEIPVSRVLSTISVLEMKRIVIRIRGNRISRQ